VTLPRAGEHIAARPFARQIAALARESDDCVAACEAQYFLERSLADHGFRFFQAQLPPDTMDALADRVGALAGELDRARKRRWRSAAEGYGALARLYERVTETYAGIAACGYRSPELRPAQRWRETSDRYLRSPSNSGASSQAG
jgi:hypothetical protein